MASSHHVKSCLFVGKKLKNPLYFVVLVLVSDRWRYGWKRHGRYGGLSWWWETQRSPIWWRTGESKIAHKSPQRTNRCPLELMVVKLMFRQTWWQRAKSSAVKGYIYIYMCTLYDHAIDIRMCMCIYKYVNTTCVPCDTCCYMLTHEAQQHTDVFPWVPRGRMVHDDRWTTGPPGGFLDGEPRGHDRVQGHLFGRP